MRRVMFWAVLVLMVIGLGGCMSPKERFLKQGAEKLTQKEIHDAYRGNTIKGKYWAAYYREDGVRIVEVYTRGTYALKWWMDPLGKFCETTTSGKTTRGLNVYRKGDQYKVFAKGHVYEFKRLPGNPLSLSK